LINALRDKDEDVRLIAAKGLGKLKAKQTIGFIISLFKDFPQEKCSIVANILIDFGEDAIPAISKALETPNLKTRFWLLRALAEIDIGSDKSKYKDLEKKLDKLLFGSGTKVRAYSAICLAKIGSPDKSKIITSLLEDGSPVVRAEACRALGILGNPEAIDKLTKCLGDEDWKVNYAASRSLIKFGKQIKWELRKNLKSHQNMVYERCKELLEELERNELV
jgi:HEAT repeat protein